MGDRDEAESIIDSLVEHSQELGRLLQKGNGEWRLRSLLKVYDWAVAQQPFAVGDRVHVVVGPFGRDHGYSPYNEVWASTPAGVVKAVEYNGHYLYWAFTVELDALPSKLFGFGASSLRKEEP